MPDFFVKTPDDTIWIVETKGRAEIDLTQKMIRLRQWRLDAILRHVKIRLAPTLVAAAHKEAMELALELGICAYELSEVQ
ncbi:MAG: hypothetical protein L0H63_09885 [Nitrococcus sp.]|nr:hypothetical protein [Nitrococcus sp.]